MTDNDKVRLTVAAVRSRKGTPQRLTMVTAYDYPSAVVVDHTPIDMILVGDSVGNNVLGYLGTVTVTMDEMLHHVRAVVRGARRTFTVADMPFGSYNASPEQAVRNGTRFMKAGADAVKLEGGVSHRATVERLVNAGIPVMGHVGLLPQTLHPDAWRVQGRDADSAKLVVADVKSLEEAGAFAIVLEALPALLAAAITNRCTVPTIGIAAGQHCDGQVLIWHDVLGLHPLQPRHVKRYANLAEVITEALSAYCRDVVDGVFPDEEHSFKMKRDALSAALQSEASSDQSP